MIELAEQILQALLDKRIPPHLVIIADELRMALMEKVREEEGYHPPPGPGGKASPPPIPGTRPRRPPLRAVKTELDAALDLVMGIHAPDPDRNRMGDREPFHLVQDVFLN